MLKKEISYELKIKTRKKSYTSLYFHWYWLSLHNKTLMQYDSVSGFARRHNPFYAQGNKKAISLLRGVIDVKVAHTEKECVNPETAQAIEEAENGKTFKCKDFDEYLKLVG